jgi:superfamily II DNA helicase RecQ
MRYKFFTIPVSNPEDAEAELNRFLAAHRILNVESNFVSNTDNSYWALCVRYTTEQPGPQVGKRAKLDYKELLSEDEFSLFVKLRELRKRIADEEAVPPYALFNNEQLAEMVRGGVTTRSDLEKIAGVGPARIEKYAEPFLSLLRAWKNGTVEKETGDAPQQGGPK